MASSSADHTLANALPSGVFHTRWAKLLVFLIPALLGPAFLCAFLTGCSPRRLVMNSVASAMTANVSAYREDDDPEMVREAVPFGLKLLEGLRAEDPNNTNLYRDLASGYTSYAKAFLEPEVEAVEARDFEAAEEVRIRICKMYQKARRYAIRGLDVAHPGFETRLGKDPEGALALTAKTDVPLLYWASAAWGSEIALSKHLPSVVADLRLVEKIARRALALDPDWGQGSLHEFFIAFDGGRSPAMGGSVERAREHLEKALSASGGKAASPYVTYAETVAVALQDRALFREMLSKAQAINPDETPDHRLANILAQRRARFLLARENELFI